MNNKKEKEELLKIIFKEIELTFNENIDGDFILTGNEWFEVTEKIKKIVLEEKTKRKRS